LKWVLFKVLVRLSLEMVAITSHTLVDEGVKHLDTFGLLLLRGIITNVAHFLLDSLNQVMSLVIHYLVAQVTFLLLGAEVADDLENLH